VNTIILAFYLPVLFNYAQVTPADVYGTLVNRDSGRTVANHLVWLCEVFRDPVGNPAGDVFVCDTARSPSIETGSDGRFYFDNVKPTEYVIVISYGELTINNYDIIDACDETSCYIVVFNVRSCDAADIVIGTWYE